MKSTQPAHSGARRAPDQRDRCIEQLLLERERLKTRVEVAEALVAEHKRHWPPGRISSRRREQVLQVIAERPLFVSLALACDALGVSRAVLYPDQRKHRKQIRKRNKGIRPNLSPADRERILALMHEERFRSLSPRQIHSTLLAEGVALASVSTLYRLLRDADKTTDGPRRLTPRGD